MMFSIITPSFNQLDFLKRCTASVADQNGIGVEHIVVDGGSEDGTVEWLTQYADAVTSQSRSDYTFRFSSEKDKGMYDALNKGLSLASGKFSAWLNCDEQYLPFALKKAAACFESHSNVGIVYGDALLVASDGRLISYRKNPTLRMAYILADHLYVQSAGMFFRTQFFHSGLHFNPDWKAVGDCEFFVNMFQKGAVARQVRDYLAVCTMTGANLSREQIGVEELQAFRSRAAWPYRFGRPVWNMLRYLEKLMRGGYHQSVPLEYDLYLDDPAVRQRLTAEQADFHFRWGLDE